MNKLDVIKFLISEIENENKKTKDYKEEVQRAKEVASEEKKAIWNVMDYEIVEGSESKIKQYLKFIRRLALEIAKEGI